MLPELIDTFTLPVIGGAMIGLSAAALMFFNGRVAGISGILSGAMVSPEGVFGNIWRGVFIAGLLIGGSLVALIQGPQVFENTVEPGIVVVAVAGLLVGFGTRLGSGCTSGHGICGLARFSPRSLVSVMTFIAAGVATVFIVNFVGGQS